MSIGAAHRVVNETVRIWGRSSSAVEEGTVRSARVVQAAVVSPVTSFQILKRETGKNRGGSAELGVPCRRARPPTANWRTLRANQLHATANTLPR
jgi:hypothetical protein